MLGRVGPHGQSFPVNRLWVPSQKGRLPERLQPQSQSVSVPRRGCTLNFTGVNAVPRCEPSQNGWLRERPQAHHRYSPAGSSTR